MAIGSPYHHTCGLQLKLIAFVLPVPHRYCFNSHLGYEIKPRFSGTQMQSTLYHRQLTAIAQVSSMLSFFYRIG